MRPSDSALIDFAEAAYDLQAEHDAWLPSVIEAGLPVLDHGLGVFALTVFRPSEPGPLAIDRVLTVSGSTDFADRLATLQTEIGTAILWPLSRQGMPKTLSEVAQAHDPAAFSAIMQHFGFAKDGLGLPAVSPDGHGVYLVIALPEVTTLSDRARERWQMLAAHFAAGHRLRRAMTQALPPDHEPTGLPLGAEAVIDPLRFEVTDAAGAAKTRPALTALRTAAQRVDRARGTLRESDPQQALALWKALVSGRWSTVDWFDSDGRRYVLGIPNAPNLLDPRGFTDREMQVLSYAFFGLTNKMIAYHLGISKSRVSGLLRSAMRKFGVQTRTQLIRKLKDFRSITGP